MFKHRRKNRSPRPPLTGRWLLAFCCLAVWLARNPPCAVAALGTPYISEFLAKNEHGLRDEKGVPEDWIEIHNPTAQAVNLEGWSLSDDPAEPSKWVFPSVELVSGAYLIVFASGDERPLVGATPLHASFSLDKDGEYLGLFQPGPDPVAVCEFAPAFPPQLEDESYGWDESAMEYRFYATPTPGQPNDGSSYTAILPPPVFNHSRGLYQAPFTLEMTDADPDAKIYYTLDGREPTTAIGRVYTGPITIDTTKFVRARAIKEGMKPSTVITHSFLFNVDITQRSIAILSLVGDPYECFYEPNGVMAIVGGNYVNGIWGPTGPNDYNNALQTGKEYERHISAEWFGPVVDKPFQLDCGLRVHGSEAHRLTYRRLDNWNTRESKFSLRLYFRDEYGPSRLDYPIFKDSRCPVESFDQIVIRGGRSDYINPFIRDEFIRRVSLDMGQLAPRGTYAVLFINGWYKHYFNITQRVTGDFLNTSWNKNAQWDIISEYQVAKEGTDEAWDALMDYIDVHDLSDNRSFSYVADRVDLINFIDYLILNTYMSNADWMANWLVVRERVSGAKFKFIVWDPESSLTNIYLETDLFEESPFYGQNGGLNYNTSQDMAVLYQALSASPEFRLMFADRIHKHFTGEGAMTPESMLKRFVECYRWMRPLLGAAMDTSIRDLWLPERGPVVLAQYESHGLTSPVAAPEFSPAKTLVKSGTAISIVNPEPGEGTIYYTTDGSDPRTALTGEKSPAALDAEVPVHLGRYTRLHARTLKDGQWSALAETNYLTASPGEVFITEIMADPLGEDEMGEWFELYNSTSRPINIDGWTIRDNSGQSHLIDNGGWLVIAPDGYLVLGRSVDRQVNGGVPVDYAYGIDIRLGDKSDEIILMQGNTVTTSLGYGDFSTAPTYIDTRLGQEPQKGVAIGMTGAYYLGATPNWAPQITPLGDSGNLATPGRCNDGGVDNGAGACWPLYE